MTSRTLLEADGAGVVGGVVAPEERVLEVAVVAWGWCVMGDG